MLRSKGKNKKQMGTWSKLVALCTKSMGGYYRSNGTIVRNIAGGKSSSEDGDAIFVETDVEFASINERTHARVRYQEVQKQENIETILSIVSGLLGDKVNMKAVDPDWANIFFDYAQNVSNKAIQSLWARAMLCELKHPGSISKRSLNFLYHCDTWEITAFKKVANYAFVGSNGHPFIFRSTKNSAVKDDIFSETRLLSHCINAGMIAAQPNELLVGFEFFYDRQKHAISHDLPKLASQSATTYSPFQKRAAI